MQRLPGLSCLLHRQPPGIVELATPLEDNSIAGKDLAKNGDMCHAVTWQVNDLDQAREYLTSKNIGIVDSDATTLLADPEDTFDLIWERHKEVPLRGHSVRALGRVASAILASHDGLDGAHGDHPADHFLLGISSRHYFSC